MYTIRRNYSQCQFLWEWKQSLARSSGGYDRGLMEMKVVHNTAIPRKVELNTLFLTVQRTLEVYLLGVFGS